MAAAHLPAVVVVGPSNVGKKTLVSGLYQLSHGDSTANPCFTPRVIEGKTVITAPLNLTTKYYSAEIEAVILPHDEFNAPSECTYAVLRSAEALVLMIDATKTETFDAAAKWAASIGEDCTASTMLLVTNKIDAATGPESAAESSPYDSVAATSHRPGPDALRGLLESMNDWCLDNGYEHVECCASKPWEKHDAREKASVPRIHEALESTMWSNMNTDVKRARVPMSESVAESKSADKDGMPADPGAESPAEQQSSSTTGAASTNELHVGQGEEDDDAGIALPPGPESDLEKLDRDMQQLFRHLQHAKETARSGNLTDEERRERAAKLAMQLFAMLGPDDGDDEDEEA